MRAMWWKQVRLWHWVSSAISLVGMILFAVTGITLNHAAAISGTPVVEVRDAKLPDPLRQKLSSAKPGLPLAVEEWLKTTLLVVPANVEWQSEDEIYVGMPGPGADAWLTIQVDTGAVHLESTSRGWIAYFNDLHKGRNTGKAWMWFLDVFAVASVVFCLTGLLLLQLHSRGRPFTWPAVSVGFVLPFLLIVFFIHR